MIAATLTVIIMTFAVTALFKGGGEPSGERNDRHQDSGWGGDHLP